LLLHLWIRSVRDVRLMCESGSKNMHSEGGGASGRIWAGGGGAASVGALDAGPASIIAWWW
jgi:hypothetical protein